jgi:hypothetical protein
VKGKLSPNQIRENRRPAIPFKPFDMVDPQTGKPVAGNTVITLPHNGKKVNAQQYYTQLNQLEQWLTQRGYSLRQRAPSNNRIPGARGTAVVELVSNERLMQQQLQRRPAGPKPNPARFQSFLPQAVRKNQLLQINAAHLQARHPQLRLDPKRLEAINASAMRGTVIGNALPLHSAASLISWVHTTGVYEANPPQCTPVNDSQPWSIDYGDPNTFHVYLNTRLSLLGQACKPPDMNHVDQSQSQFTLTETATGGGTLFGIGGDILTLTATADLSAPSNSAGLGVDVLVFGQNVYDYHPPRQTAEWEAKDGVSQPLDFSTDIQIPVVGPISIDVTIGARGSVGVSYDLYLSPTYAQGGIQPFMNAQVYAQAGVGVPDVVDVGVGVNLTLVNWTLNLGAAAGLYTSLDPSNYLEFVLKDDLYANIAGDGSGQTPVSILAGQLYAFAKVGHPCFAFPPWCVDEYDFPIWGEPGLTFGPLELFNTGNEVRLNWASAMPMDMPTRSEGAGVPGGLQ